MEEKLERHTHKLRRECPPHWVEHFYSHLSSLSGELYLHNNTPINQQCGTSQRHFNPFLLVDDRIGIM